jgi:sugar phosphate permease
MKQVFPGWWQVLICMLNQAAGPGTIIICFSLIAAPLHQTYGTNRGTLGLLMTLIYLVNGLISPWLGVAMDRYSIRRFLIAGGLALGGGYVALSFATSIIFVFLVFGLLLATANAALGPLSYSTLLPRWFFKKRARAVGLTVAGYAAGGLLLPPLFAFLIEAFGWRDALRLYGVFVLVIMVPLIAWAIIDRPSECGLFPDGDDSAFRDVARVSVDPPSQTTGTVLRNPNFWIITLTIAIVLCGSGGLLSNMVPFAASRGFTAKQAALLLTCFSAGSLTSKLLYTFFGDRLNPRVGLAIGLFFFTLSSCLFLRGFSYPLLVVGNVLHGMGVGTALPLWSYLTARVFGTANVGRVFGLMNIVILPISLSMPPVMGAIFDRTGAYDNGFILYISLGVAAFLLLPNLRVTSLPKAVPAAAARR